MRRTRRGGLDRPVVAVEYVTKGNIGHSTVPFRAGRPRATRPAPSTQEADSAATGAHSFKAPLFGAVYSSSARMGLKIGLRAQGTQDQEAGPVWRSLAQPFRNQSTAVFPAKAAVVYLRAGMRIALAVLALALLSTSPSSSLSEGPALAAGPQAAPTYFSEVGPASTRAPKSAAGLPASGTGTDSSSYWPAAAGFALSLLGGALIHASRTRRPRATA